jgi:hypothetical protein
VAGDTGARIVSEHGSIPIPATDAGISATIPPGAPISDHGAAKPVTAAANLDAAVVMSSEFVRPLASKRVFVLSLRLVD